MGDLFGCGCGRGRGGELIECILKLSRVGVDGNEMVCVGVRVGGRGGFVSNGVGGGVVAVEFGVNGKRENGFIKSRAVDGAELNETEWAGCVGVLVAHCGGDGGRERTKRS